MAEHFISRTDAESNFLDAAAFLAESIPSGETHGSAIAAVVPLYLGKGNVDLAAELANTIDDPFTRDRLLIAVASKCAELDDDEYALQLVEAIEDQGFQGQGFEQIGAVKADKGEFEKAGDVATMMIHPDRVFARIAIRQAADGDDESALKTIGEIEFPRDAVTALSTIAAVRINEQGSESAIEMLSKAEAKAAEIEHDEERIRAMCEIGNLFIDAGDKGRAFVVYENARSDAEKVGSVHRDALLAHVAIGFLSAGSVEQADRVLDAVGDKTQIASVILAFARDHWQKGETDEAFEALEEAFAVLRSQHENETRDSRSKFILLGSVAAQFAGFEKCERAIEVADAIPDETQKSNAFSQIAQIATTQGSHGIAEQALSQIEGELDRTVTTILMSMAAKKAVDVERSDALLEKVAGAIPKLSEPTTRYSAFTELSRAYFEPGNLESSLTAFDKAIAALLEVRSSNFKVSGLAELSKMSEEFGIELTDERREMLKRFLR